MNLIPIILIAFMLMNSGSKNSNGGFFNLGNLFGTGNSQSKSNNDFLKGFDFAKIAPLLANPNALAALESVNKLMDKNNRQDKTSVIFELLANPFVGELLAVLSSGNNSNHNDNDTSQMNNSSANTDNNSSNGNYNADIYFKSENNNNNTENKTHSDKVNDTVNSTTDGNSNSVNANTTNTSQYDYHEEKPQYDGIIDEIRSRILGSLE